MKAQRYLKRLERQGEHQLVDALIKMAMAMGNRYPGKCFICSQTVDAGEGYAENLNNKWCVFHPDCYDQWKKQRKAPQATPGRGELKRSPEDPNVGILTFPYDAQTVRLVKTLPERQYVKEPSPHWLVSLDPKHLSRVLGVVSDLKFKIADDIVAAGEEKTPVHQLALDRGLYDFQAEDADWLARQPKAILGHDMGLGKTAISLLALPMNRGTLVVCPKAVVFNWLEEVKKWRPELKTHVVSGSGMFRFPQPGEIVITNYEQLPAEMLPQKDDRGYYAPDQISDALKAKLQGVTLIVDEAHFVKNTKAQRTGKVMAMSRQTPATWFLTGTPLANRPMDLWGVLSAGNMTREAFGGWQTFFDMMGGYKTPQKIRGGRTIMVTNWGMPKEGVPDMLRRVMIRRRKADTLTLPPKQYSNRLIDVEDPELSQQLDMAMGEWADLAKSQRQAQDDFSPIDYDDEYGSGPRPSFLPPFEQFSGIRASLAAAKTPAAIKVVEEFEARGEPLIVFSAHRSPVDAIGTRPGWARIYGGTPAEERADIVAKFQNGELAGVALTIGAGGVGLTLTRASNVLFVDQAWRPCDNLQAEDRIYRIGQRASEVNVIKLLIDHELEIHIAQLLEIKQRWIEAAVENLIEIAVEENAASDDPVSDADLLQRVTEQAEQQAERTPVRKEDYQKEEQEDKKTTRTENEQGEQIDVMPDAQKQIIMEALYQLLSVCDGARQLDGCGFNKYDANSVRGLLSRMQARSAKNPGASEIELVTEGEFRFLQRTLQKYKKRQLGDERFQTIWQTPQPAAPQAPAAPEVPPPVAPEGTGDESVI